MPEPPKAPANDWIKIKVVDDQSGEVIPKVVLNLKTPDNSTEQHETRLSGMIESLGLQSGDCEVSCEINDLTLKNTLLFVGVGDEPIEKPKEGVKAEGIPDPEPNNRYRIVNVEKHVVQKGDSFRKLANAAGIGRDALDKFNWPREGIYTPNEDLYTSDIIYIPRKWSQKGYETNRVHTIRVKREFFVEDDVTKKAGGAVPLLTCAHDPSFGNGDGVRFKYEEGALKCSHVVGFDKRICDVSEDKRAAIKEHASFVYMDVGCWADNADGNQTKCRNFGLVCGPHVYLCKYILERQAPNSRVPSVQQFFREMLDQGCGIEVISYAYSGDETRRPKEDSDLYLFLGDLHLPPRNWDVKFHFFQDYIRLGNLSDPDIFKQAGKDLSTFLNALANLSSGIKKLLHFIQTGDMLELWLGESYLFKPGTEKPEWINAEAPAQAARWARDALGGNLSVSFAFQGLEEAGLAETRFVWGNHDGYLQDRQVAKDANLPARYASYEGLNGEIFCEHGHRFDQKNYDNRDPKLYVINLQTIINYTAYSVPPTRKIESPMRLITGIGHLDERNSCLMGAGLLNLNLRVDQKKSPFAIYVMGHTHRCMLCRCIIEPKIAEES